MAVAVATCKVLLGALFNCCEQDNNAVQSALKHYPGNPLSARTSQLLTLNWFMGGVVIMGNW